MEIYRVAGMVKNILFFFVILLLSSCSQTNIDLSGNISDGVVLNNSGRLDKLLRGIEPSAEYALLIGSDGTAAFITSSGFTEIYIQKDKSKWNSESKTLPAFCNIYDLEEICIYTETSDSKNEFAERLKKFDFLGQSSKNGFYARKYKEKTGE